ncbi:hypothetical protein SEVIR_5G351601v4 [Setaria viridis]
MRAAVLHVPSKLSTDIGFDAHLLLSMDGFQSTGLICVIDAAHTKYTLPWLVDAFLLPLLPMPMSKLSTSMRPVPVRSSSSRQRRGQRRRAPCGGRQTNVLPDACASSSPRRTPTTPRCWATPSGTEVAEHASSIHATMRTAASSVQSSVC